MVEILPMNFFCTRCIWIMLFLPIKICAYTLCLALGDDLSLPIIAAPWYFLPGSFPQNTAGLTITHHPLANGSVRYDYFLQNVLSSDDDLHLFLYFSHNDNHLKVANIDHYFIDDQYFFRFVLVATKKTSQIIRITMGIQGRNYLQIFSERSIAPP